MLQQLFLSYRCTFNSNYDFYVSVRASDKRIHCDEEYSDSEDEMGGPNESGGRRDRVSFKQKPKRLRTDEEKKAEGNWF